MSSLQVYGLMSREFGSLDLDYCVILVWFSKPYLFDFFSFSFFSLPTTCTQERTRVGADTSQDIQLFGIGIQAEHGVLELCPDGDVTLMPVGNAR